MTQTTRLVIAIAFALLIPFQTSATPILVGAGDQTGSRATATDIIGNGGWTAANGGLKVSWDISFSAGLWHYKYTFTNADGTEISPDVSHVLLEVSLSITDNNVSTIIFNENFDPEGPTTWVADASFPSSASPGANNANPNLPADLYGIKFDTESGDVEGMYTFDSTRAPMWGDIYIKDGVGGGPSGGLAVAWNSGIGTDPTLTTTDFNAWVPVPDTTSGTNTSVDAPASWLLLASGLVVMRFARRR